uniref:Uncharacterized protein n=2 Tax=Parascaris TaxID=6254 RepID=A0A914ZRY5_PARUN
MFPAQINAFLLVELFSTVISRPLLSSEVVYTILAHSGGASDRRDGTLQQSIGDAGSRLPEVGEKGVDAAFSEVLEERTLVHELQHTSVKSEYLAVVPISRELPSRVVATIDRGNHEMSGVYNTGSTGDMGTVVAMDTSEQNVVLSDEMSFESAVSTTPACGVGPNDDFPHASAPIVKAGSEFRDSVVGDGNPSSEVSDVRRAKDAEFLNSGDSLSAPPSAVDLKDWSTLQLNSSEHPSPSSSAIVYSDKQSGNPGSKRHAGPPLGMESPDASDVLDVPLNSGNAYPANNSSVFNQKESVSEILEQSEEHSDPFIKTHDHKVEAAQDEPIQTDPKLVPEGLKISGPKDASSGRIIDPLETSVQHLEQQNLDKPDPFKSESETIVVEEEKQLNVGEEINKDSINELIKSKVITEDVEESDRMPNKYPSESSKLHPQVISESGVTKCCVRESATLASTTQETLSEGQRQDIDNASHSENTEINDAEEEESNSILSNRIWSFWDKLIAGIKCSQRDCSEALHTIPRARRPLVEPSIIRRARKHSNDH